MTILERLKGIGIAMIILVLAFPLSVLATLISSPFWSWFEQISGIEAYGHSGPAEWCYLTLYLATIAAATYVWVRMKQRA